MTELRVPGLNGTQPCRYTVGFSRHLSQLVEFIQYCCIGFGTRILSPRKKQAPARPMSMLFSIACDPSGLRSLKLSLESAFIMRRLKPRRKPRRITSEVWKRNSARSLMG
uniref:Uncharacterized protein n=1 Tax=Rhizochromulina marina TaxID=1034831 RepID=A0A7S2SU57_9STRA